MRKKSGKSDKSNYIVGISNYIVGMSNYIVGMTGMRVTI